MFLQASASADTYRNSSEQRGQSGPIMRDFAAFVFSSSTDEPFPGVAVSQMRDAAAVGHGLVAQLVRARA